jgi:hypothetical protein
MKYRITIKKDGQKITEVLDREGQDCKNVSRLTDQFGRVASEEITAQDCETVQESVS